MPYALKPLRDEWRHLSSLLERNQIVYLDVEGDGGNSAESVTLVGTYSKRAGYKAFVKGKNLPELGQHLSQYKGMVTFYGGGFDLPILSRLLGEFYFPLHFDLQIACRRFELWGGLKKIEATLGIPRSSSENGESAKELWSRYQQGDQRSLDILTAYNREDVVNLAPLVCIIVKMLSDDTFCREIRKKFYPTDKTG